MIESDLERVLRGAFLAAIPAAAGVTAFENQPFEPKGWAKWFGFHFLPNVPEVATLGLDGEDEITGLVQIDININAGRGKEGIEDDLFALRSVFAAGTRIKRDFLNVRIKNCGRIGAGNLVDGFYRYSVSISFEARFPRNVVDLVTWTTNDPVLW
jgi:hypothetical protein